MQAQMHDMMLWCPYEHEWQINKNLLIVIVRPLFRSPRGCRPPDWC